VAQFELLLLIMIFYNCILIVLTTKPKKIVQRIKTTEDCKVDSNKLE